MLFRSNASDNEESGDVVIMPVVQTKDVRYQTHRFINWLPSKEVVPTSWRQANARGRWALIRNRLLVTAIVVIPTCIF